MSRVTVIMPVYNGERFLKESIESILNQTYQDFTLLCINDCSTDNSLSIIQKYNDPRIKIIQNKVNLGIGSTRNVGLEMADTEYIALLDDDDISPLYRLEHEIQYLDNHLDIQIVGGHLREIDEFGNDLNNQWSVYLNPDYIKACLLLENTVANGTVMIRKSFIDEHNIRYKDNMCGVEDYMFWVECSLRGNIKNLDEVLLFWRITDQNETSRMLKKYKQERMKAFLKIRRYVFEQYGFEFLEEELLLLNKIFSDGGIAETREELDRLFCILKKIAYQSKELKISNSKEIITMCRKYFSKKVGKAFFLWD